MPQDPFAAIAKPVTPPAVVAAGNDPFAAIAKPPEPSFSDIIGTAWDRMKEAYRGDTKLTDYDAATLSGVGSIARGTVGAVKGAAEMLKPPSWEEVQDAIKDSAANPAMFPLTVLAKRMGKPLVDVAKMVPEIPGAIHDINASPDPLGTYAKAAQETAGQGAGQALTAIAGEGIAKGVPSVVEKVAPVISNAVEVVKSVTPKQAAQVAGGVGGGVVSHAGTPALSPVGAYYGAKGAGSLVESVVGKERANQPLIAPSKPFNAGAPLPEAPDPALLKSQGLAEGGKPASSPSDALGKIPVEQQIPGVNVRPSIERVTPSPVNVGAPLPEAPEPVVAQAKGLAEGGKQPVDPAAALAKIPTRAVNQAVKELGPQAPITNVVERANQIMELLNKGMGGKALEPNVPLKNQGGIVTPKSAEALTVLEGHTPVDSSALKSYSYDPKTNELEIGTGPKSGYVYGDVSPEQAQSFIKGKFTGQKATDAPSFGKAWNDLRQAPGVTSVAKIINGKRVPIPRVMSDEDLIPADEWEAGHALETQVEGTPR